MVNEKDTEHMRYEKCIKEYKDLLGDLTFIKEGKNLSGSEFVIHCDGLINEFKTIKYLNIVEEQARAMAINDLSDFISEVKDIKPGDF